MRKGSRVDISVHPEPHIVSVQTGRAELTGVDGLIGRSMAH